MFWVGSICGEQQSWIAEKRAEEQHAEALSRAFVEGSRRVLGGLWAEARRMVGPGRFNPGCRTLTERPRNTASIRKAIAKSSLPVGHREQLALFSHSWW